MASRRTVIWRLLTLSSAGEEPACFERKHFDETEARVFCYTDV